MDLKKIGKMLDAGYGTEDSNIAKQLLLSQFPKLKEYLIYKGQKYITKEKLIKLGIKIDFKWDAISFPKYEFPEVWGD